MNNMISDSNRKLFGALLSKIRQARQKAFARVNTAKDSYLLEFLSLPPDHIESNLQKALIRHMKQFILELGTDLKLEVIGRVAKAFPEDRMVFEAAHKKSAWLETHTGELILYAYEWIAQGKPLYPPK